MLLAIAYALVALFGLLGIAVHPGRALIGYYVVAFARPNEMDWTLFPARLSMPLVAAALIGAVVYFMRHGYPKVRSTQMKLFVVMVLHFFISGKMLESTFAMQLGHARAVDGMTLWAKFDIYRNMMIVAVLGSRVLCSERWIHRTLITIGGCAAFLGLWANYHYFVLRTYPITGPGPPMGLSAGIFADRNDFCIILTMGLPICWYMGVLAKRWWVKMAWLGSMPFILHAVLLTESRGGLLGVGAAMAYITFRSRRRKLLVIANTIGLSVMLIYFTNDALMERYGTIGDYEEDASAKSRLNTWNVGWRIMWGNPFFGVGLENFIEVFYDYSDWKPEWRLNEDKQWEIVRGFDYEANEAHQAHNMWIQRGGETGVVGFILLVWFVVSIPMATFRVRRWLGELKKAGHIDEDAAQRAATLTNCIEGAMVPYLTTAFFLSMEDFEGLYAMGTLTACLLNWVRQVRESAGAEPAGQSPAPTVEASGPVAASRFPPPRVRA